jgi:hypothetical protein
VMRRLGATPDRFKRPEHRRALNVFFPDGK